MFQVGDILTQEQMNNLIEVLGFSNIREGQEIVFSNPDNGYKTDQEKAKEHLTIGRVYTLFDYSVGDWHTEACVICDDGNVRSFNSVLFSPLVFEEGATPEVSTQPSNSSIYSVITAEDIINLSAKGFDISFLHIHQGEAPEICVYYVKGGKQLRVVMDKNIQVVIATCELFLEGLE